MIMGHDGGLVVSVLAYYSNNWSLKPALYLNFMQKNMKLNENEAGVGPSSK